jgi:hypothetical protein
VPGAVHTRDEAIAVIDRALGEFDDGSQGTVLAAKAVVSEVHRRADGAVNHQQRVVEELVRALQSLNEDENRAATEAALLRAQQRLDDVRRARNQVERAASRLDSVARAFGPDTASMCSRGKSRLRTLSEELANYRAGQSFGAGGSAARLGGVVIMGARVAPASPSGSGDPSSGRGNAGAREQLSEVGVDHLDYPDNPIGAVEAWDTKVKPALARGAGRDELAARDTASNARPLRRLADVYDIFLGSDAITVSRMSNGKLDVQNGRHRIEVAREMGVRSLPVRVLS